MSSEVMECTGEIEAGSAQPPWGHPDIRFPGQYFDEETGLHYNRFRYYDPEVGRYVSADPIGQLGGFNLYSYATNSPVGLIDPFALNPLQKIVEFVTRKLGKMGAVENAIAETFKRERDRELEELGPVTDPVAMEEINQKFEERMRQLDELYDKSSFERTPEDARIIKNAMERQHGIDIDGDGAIGPPLVDPNSGPTCP